MVPPTARSVYALPTMAKDTTAGLSRSLMIAGAILLALAVPAAAAAAPPGFSVEGISFKLFDETSGKVVSFDKPPNPYGLNIALLVIVKLKGPSEGDVRGKLTLSALAP